MHIDLDHSYPGFSLHSLVVSEESDEHAGTSQTHMSPATVIVPVQTLLPAPA